MDNATSDQLSQLQSALLPDDLECLMAVARRSALQSHFITAQGARLEKLGLLTIADGWPTLTANGWRVVDQVGARLILSMHEPEGTSQQSGR